MKFGLKTTLAISVAAALAGSANAGEIKQPTEDNLPSLTIAQRHNISCHRVLRNLGQNHYRQDVVLDGEFAENVYDEYFRSLDPFRTLFLKSEHDAFSKDADELRDGIVSCNLKDPFDIYEKYMHLKMKQYAFMIDYLEQSPDLTADEELSFDRDNAKWLNTPEERADAWKKQTKYELISLILSGKTEEKARSLLKKRYVSRMNYLVQTKSEDAFSAFESALVAQYDPHTAYFSPRDAEEFKSNLIDMSIEGIGATLSIEDDSVTIVEVMPGGPADKSGQLKPKDQIIGVGQEPGKIVDIVGMRLDDAVDLIRGPKGSTVYLTIQRGEGAAAKIFPLTLVRDKIAFKDKAASSEIIEVAGKKVGIIKVSSFYAHLTDDAKVILEKFSQQKVDAVVVDLRRNGGGLVTEATSFSGLFIEKGPILQTRDRKGNVRSSDDIDSQVQFKGPLVVLVNRQSASASEIFAAAMQDYGRAIVVGTNTFGKGTVQQVTGLAHFYDLFDGDVGSLSFTIDKFYRVNGGSTQLKGVAPHIDFPSSFVMEEYGESSMKNALPWDTIKPSEYVSAGDVAKFVPELTKLHDDRVAKDPDYQILVERAAEEEKLFREKSVSVNLLKRKADQAAQEAKELKRMNEQLGRMGRPAVEKTSELPDDVELPDAAKIEAANIACDLAYLSAGKSREEIVAAYKLAFDAKANQKLDAADKKSDDDSDAANEKEKLSGGDSDAAKEKAKASGGDSDAAKENEKSSDVGNAKK